MKQHPVFAEVAALAADTPRRCVTCHRYMRYWPRRAGTLRRAAGRDAGCYCDLCVFGPLRIVAALFSEPITPADIAGVRNEQARQVLAQLAELTRLPATAQLGQAIELLYMQLQLVAEDLDVLGRLIADEEIVRPLFDADAPLNLAVPWRRTATAHAQA